MHQHTKILLVDDDADDLHFFFEAIREIDPALACAFAANGSEAIKHLDTVAPLPSLIFLDLNMPGMNGIEFLETMRKKYPSIPVVMYTTSSDPADKNRTLAAGANYFLTKPNDFKTIKDQLLKVLEMDFSS